MRRLAEQGYVGVAIEGALWGLHNDNPVLLPLYEAAADAGLMVSLTVAQGVSRDDLTFAHPDPIRRVAKLIPETPVLVVHACWPWTTLACALAYECPNVYLLPDVYIAVRAPGWREYIDAANGFLMDRMLFGSAYPIRPLSRAVREYESAGFDEPALEAVLYGNAARLLGPAAANPSTPATMQGAELGRRT
jgi:predicted TIM-barrel fold metal-dependent hydrolase